MSNSVFHSILKKEIDRIDEAKTSKRREKIIEGFTKDSSPKALIQNKQYVIFNSNDYLGLRFNDVLKHAEVKASERYGAGPGAVRFISGTMKIYKDLEKELADFHAREDAMVFSSAFATNMAVLFCLIKGQSKDSVVGDNVLVLSDALNHRSIIDGIRVANLAKEQRQVYRHLDYAHLGEILKEQIGKFKRVLVITDGVFSMLGECLDIDALKRITKPYEDKYEEGVHVIVDDSHGVAAYGKNGKGIEDGAKEKADVLIGTLGKGFGADGGYVTADKIIIDYLRESAATYIYSNSISPSVAGAALASVKLIVSQEGKELLEKSRKNISLFKQLANQKKLEFAAFSSHPIQPILVGDPAKTKKLTEFLFENGIIVTSINYPVVPKGRDEIRVQISANHTESDIRLLTDTLRKAIDLLK